MGAGRLGMFCQVRRRASWPSHPPMTLVLDARQRHSENFREVVTLCSLCIEFSLKAGEPQLPPEMAKAVGEATRHDAPSTLAPLEAGFFGGPVQDHAERGPSEDCVSVRLACVQNLNVASGPFHNAASGFRFGLESLLCCTRAA